MGSLQKLIKVREEVSDIFLYKAKELLSIAKEYGVVGRHNMAKHVLRQSIIDAINKQIAETIEADIADARECKPKLDYINTAIPGVLVAFHDPKANRMRSAKVVEKYEGTKTMKLQTEYGATFIINYDQIAWVRTTGRWPRGIYNALKGIKGNAEEAK